MRCLNSPPDLNSLETKILESVSANARHVIVVNAGDGRLARAIREKLGDSVAIKVVEERSDLRPYLDDFEGIGSDPWNVSWYEKQAEAHGPVDSLIFYQVHEYWSGEVETFARILRLLGPEGSCWVAFLNFLATRNLERMLPPLQLSWTSLADPVRLARQVDLASWLAYFEQIKAEPLQLWGLLDPQAFEYCQNRPKEAGEWGLRGMKIKVSTLADAFLWGASVCAVEVRSAREGAAPRQPTFSGAPYSGLLFQALVYPYSSAISRQGELLVAEQEAETWKKEGKAEVGNLVEFYFSRIDDAPEVRSALLLGAGWGKDLVALKRFKPEWEWTGVDFLPEKVELGRQELAAEPIRLELAGLGERLPFEDDSFDVVLSLGQFSTLHYPAGKQLAEEALRVARKGVYFLEDSRGPDHSMHLKIYSLRAIYAGLKKDATVEPILLQGNNTGMYVLKLKK